MIQQSKAGAGKGARAAAAEAAEIAAAGAAAGAQLRRSLNSIHAANTKYPPQASPFNRPKHASGPPLPSNDEVNDGILSAIKELSALSPPPLVMTWPITSLSG